MVAHELLDKHGRRIGQHVVKADAAADEDLLDARNRAELAEKREIVRVVGDQVFTRRGEQALPVLTGTSRELLFACRLPEIRCGAADVVDVALEIGVARHEAGLF